MFFLWEGIEFTLDDIGVAGLPPLRSDEPVEGENQIQAWTARASHPTLLFFHCTFKPSLHAAWAG